MHATAIQPSLITEIRQIVPPCDTWPVWLFTTSTTTNLTEFCWIHQLLLQTLSNKLIWTTVIHSQQFLVIWYRNDHHSVWKHSNFGGVSTFQPRSWWKIWNDIITKKKHDCDWNNITSKLYNSFSVVQWRNKYVWTSRQKQWGVLFRQTGGSWLKDKCYYSQSHQANCSSTSQVGVLIAHTKTPKTASQLLLA